MPQDVPEGLEPSTGEPAPPGTGVDAADLLRPSGAAVRGTLTALDQLAGLATRLLGVQSARISLRSGARRVVGAAGPQPLSGVAGGERLLQRLCTRTVAEAEPVAVADLTDVAAGANGAYLGVPVTVADGRAVGVVCVCDPGSRTWRDQDADVLRQIAAVAAVQQELTAFGGEHESSRTLLELTVAAAELGTFDLDLATGRLELNERLLELSALERETFSGRPEDVYANIHPDDRESTIARVDDAVRLGTGYSAEYRIVLPSGQNRWIAARGATLAGEDGTTARLLGAAFDVTAVRQAGAWAEHVMDSMAVGHLAMDADWRITYVNAEAERALGRPRAELVGGVIWELFPATAGTDFEAGYRRAVETGRPFSFDAYYPDPLNAWYEVRATPGVDGLALYFLNITERKLAQRAAEDAAARMQFLAAVSEELTGALDVEAAVARLAQLVVPGLADWCLVSVLDDDASGTRAGGAAGRTGELRRGLRDVASWHRDEQARDAVREYAAVRLGELNDDAFVWQALRRGGPVVIDDLTRAVTPLLDPAGRGRALLAELAPAHGVVLPLRGRGRTVGLLSLFTGAQRDPLDAQEVATAVDVAARAGLALDSARLYRQQRDLAEGLQRFLLTDPPQPDHGQIVVRYLPAAVAAQVGGDWYDAFLQPGGETVLVIGDVAGHDTEAAATMSQVRSTVRSVGVLGDESPAQILARTDQVMANLQMTATATTIVARLEQTPRERERGTTRLRWSSAGHPPAMVVHADGSVQALAGEHADLLLGVLPTLPRHEHEAVLDRGATVLLYTDGLVERRDQPLADGLHRLERTLRELAAEGVDLDTLVDRVLTRMLPSRRTDDVAVIAVRLHPRDRPRPPEAGPRRVPRHVPAPPD